MKVVFFFSTLELSAMQLGYNGGNQPVNFGSRWATNG